MPIIGTGNIQQPQNLAASYLMDQANQQANMISGIGGLISSGIQKWKDKKDEEDMIGGWLETHKNDQGGRNDIIDVIYEGRNIPEEKELKKELHQFIDAVGGVPEVMREVRAMRADQRAEAAAQRADQIQQQSFQIQAAAEDDKLAQSRAMQALITPSRTGQRAIDSPSIEGARELASKSEMGPLRDRENFYLEQLISKKPSAFTLGGAELAKTDRTQYTNSHDLEADAREKLAGAPPQAIKAFIEEKKKDIVKPSDIQETFKNSVKENPVFDELVTRKIRLGDVHALLGGDDVTALDEVGALTSMIRIFEQSVLTDADIDRYAGADASLLKTFYRAMNKQRAGEVLLEEDRQAIKDLANKLKTWSRRVMTDFGDQVMDVARASYPGLTDRQLLKHTTYDQWFSTSAGEVGVGTVLAPPEGGFPGHPTNLRHLREQKVGSPFGGGMYTRE